MHRTIAALLLLSTCLFAAEPPASLTKKEATARRRVAEELHRLGKFCVANKAFDEARSVLRAGLAIAPNAKKLKSELRAIEGEPDEPKSGFEAKYRAKREAAEQKCGKWLSDAAKAFDKKGFPDRYDRLVRLITTHFPSPAAMKELDLVWFEPYRQWVRQADAKKLTGGWERIDGEWRDPKQVAKLDREHATWANPWVLTDGYHELRTNTGIRNARRVLAHITAFREFFLGMFAGEWDLRRPAGKLPVILTRTQAGFQSQMQKALRGRGAAARPGTAFYLWTNNPLNPCFVTFEPVDAAGRSVVVEVDHVFPALRHEIAHQLAFECSKYDADHSRQPSSHYWSVEGIANYVKNFVLTKDGWRLARRRTWRMGIGMLEGDFAHCVATLGRLPSLQELFGKPARGINTVQLYHMVATASWFLLEGEKKKYRKSFLRLLERVHKARETPDTFEKCFAGVDMGKLQKEWEAFVRSIQLESD